MTAHPESVVGRLRAALTGGWSPEHTEPDAPYQYHAEAIEHAPALLAALEKEWNEACDVIANTSKYGDDAECAARRYALGVCARLAPLFEKPEKTT